MPSTWIRWLSAWLMLTRSNDSSWPASRRHGNGKSPRPAGAIGGWAGRRRGQRPMAAALPHPTRTNHRRGGAEPRLPCRLGANLLFLFFSTRRRRSAPSVATPTLDSQWPPATHIRTPHPPREVDASARLRLFRCCFFLAAGRGTTAAETTKEKQTNNKKPPTGHGRTKRWVRIGQKKWKFFVFIFPNSFQVSLTSNRVPPKNPKVFFEKKKLFSLDFYIFYFRIGSIIVQSISWFSVKKKARNWEKNLRGWTELDLFRYHYKKKWMNSLFLFYIIKLILLTDFEDLTKKKRPFSLDGTWCWNGKFDLLWHRHYWVFTEFFPSTGLFFFKRNDSLIGGENSHLIGRRNRASRFCKARRAKFKIQMKKNHSFKKKQILKSSRLIDSIDAADRKPAKKKNKKQKRKIELTPPGKMETIDRISFSNFVDLLARVDRSALALWSMPNGNRIETRKDAPVRPISALIRLTHTHTHSVWRNRISPLWFDWIKVQTRRPRGADRSSLQVRRKEKNSVIP